MDLIRCQAVCRSWRGIIQGNDGLWKDKVRGWDPAECTLLKDAMDFRQELERNTPGQRQRQYAHDGECASPAEMDALLEMIESRPGFIGWKEAVIQGLALKQHWKRGRFVHQLIISLTMDIKPVLLAWPLLILVDGWPRVHKISLDGFRGVRYLESPQQNGRNYQLMEVPRGHGSVSCIAWDSAASATTRASLTTEVHDENGQESLPLALGGFLRVNTKVLQVITVDYGSRMFEREEGGDIITWQEAVCLAHEDGVIIKDEHSHTLCQIQLEVGSKLIHIQAIADNTWPYRNEILILYEEPNTRQRLVLCVKMEPGYRKECSRRLLTPGFSLGRGGDARDSIAMYRDRIGIMSHRNCSSDLGHYCVLRLLDLKEDVAVSTEYALSESVEADDDGADATDVGDDNEVQDSGGGNGGNLKATKVYMRGKAIRLDHSMVHKAAYRILALDHARIVLGIGPRTIKILYLV
ncbi:hypothetical protein BGW39_001404 [Mortierella sp. 14UC]|nr:hypothetical protein BGW39_001404 [Mortierella sp. 14UC]